MRDLVERIGAATIANNIGVPHNLKAPPPLRGRSAMQSIDGWEALEGGRAAIGVGLPFGRTSACNLRHLTEQATEAGATELRLTPWRTVFIPCGSKEDARHLAQALPPDAFILDPADPRRRVAACVGAPACQRATTNVREDASHLARLAAATQFLHLSGCAKGCAHPRLAPLTLVGNNGRYDLIRDGAPSDSPIRKGLTLDEASAYLREMAANDTQSTAS
jgi:precorrin-3B synthase